MARTSKVLGKAELLNIQGISPLVSKVDVKILYLGENRNRYDISEEVAIKLMSRIRCLPIVGHFIPEKNDFRGHDILVTKEGGSITEKEITIPYGFIPENAKIWKQDFQELDENNNLVNRTYFIIEGYIWTGVYPESARVLLGKNHQSMELDENTICGEWAINPNSGVDFFILDDAVLTKLCILGEDVEPCFEGADIVPSNANFSLSDEEEVLITNFMLVFNKHLKGVSKLMENKEKKEEKVNNPDKEDKKVKAKEEKEDEEEKDNEEVEAKEDKENKEEKEDEEEKVSNEKTQKEEKDKEKEPSKKDKENKNTFSTDELCKLVKPLFDSLKELSCRIGEVEKNLKKEETEEETEENKKKKEMIAKFSSMSVSEMEEALDEKEKETEEENQNKLEKNITTFSNVNSRELEYKENEKIPEFVSYIQKFND